jgi:hypothetical protein
MKYVLRIPSDEIVQYRDRYGYAEGKRLEKFHGVAQSHGYISVDQLHDICLWKSKRRAELAKKNPDALVRELTAFSFSARCEPSKLGALTLLEGVQFPTASVILHFCLDQTYPILDIRALWSLSIEKPSQYTLPFWEDYVATCRAIAQENGLSVRELDMALWQYSKENQK